MVFLPRLVMLSLCKTDEHPEMFHLFEVMLITRFIFVYNTSLCTTITNTRGTSLTLRKDTS
ncbi:hypothetical protein IY73_03685 [Lawsonella clevelandensis]|nr:hypothetical protein IY73_03685 [Lawsonella clevelandensis]